MNPNRFHQAVLEEITKGVPQENGIGTLSEKMLHAVLKRCYTYNEQFREVKVGPFVADVFDGDTITEIQTRNFGVLRRKLDYYLGRFPVRVVYPMYHIRNIHWVNPETGETSKPHKGRRVGTPAQALHELWQIKDYLCHPELTIEIILLDVEEYRYLNGWGKDRKHGSTRIDCTPREIEQVIELTKPSDYQIFLPESLPEQFTVPMFQKAAGLKNRQAYSAVHVLEAVHIIEECGKSGRAICYRRAQS